MRIYKFGGSILRNSNDMEALCETILRAGEGPLVIVISALGSFTRDLESASLLASSGAREKAVSLIEESRWRTLQLADAVLRKDVGSEEFRQRDHELYTRCMDLLRGISITGQRTTRVGHMIRALGEDWAMALVSAVLRERGIRHSTMDARLVVRTGPAHGECRPDLTSTREQVRALLRPELDR
ncbi:MAG: hypothetical protein ACKO9V_07075, partial [Candidatus Kapaibacterium sp.]